MSSEKNFGQLWSMRWPNWAVEYLFAMKCRAMRIGGIETNSDIEDIKLLARAIGLKNSQDALTLVEKFYPQNMLQPKTRLGLEEIFSILDTDHGNGQTVPSSSPP